MILADYVHAIRVRGRNGRATAIRHSCPFTVHLLTRIAWIGSTTNFKRVIPSRDEENPTGKRVRGPRENMSVSVTEISRMSDRELLDRAWRLTTNVGSCGGASRKGRLLAMRRLRRLGVRFFIGGWHAGDECNAGTAMGIIIPGEPDPTVGLDWIYTGVSIDHAAAKLGAGDAAVGWERYWRF